MQKIVRCPKPECQSLDVWRFGFDYSNGEKAQKYKCKKCGHVWSEGKKKILRIIFKNKRVKDYDYGHIEKIGIVEE